MPKNHYSIVGFKHRGPQFEAAVHALKAGAPLRLVREPTNQYDPNAIQVWADGVHIGYLPKAQNAALAARMAKANTMAADSAAQRDATLHRSPNSNYPMAEVDE